MMTENVVCELSCFHQSAKERLLSVTRGINWPREQHILNESTISDNGIYQPVKGCQRLAAQGESILND